ncbi:hypothetical protein KCP78_08390 [Salmonella enterica subsp. enterica]|nr:hypothetical protein KCP78_08390 [Salmonella enterica subsp. enterica]
MVLIKQRLAVEAAILPSLPLDGFDVICRKRLPGHFWRRILADIVAMQKVTR